MQSQSSDMPEEVNMMKLLSKIQTLEAQKSLLVEVDRNKDLLESKIVPSLQPKIGREFDKFSLENKKQKKSFWRQEGN